MGHEHCGCHFGCVDQSAKTGGHHFLPGHIGTTACWPISIGKLNWQGNIPEVVASGVALKCISINLNMIHLGVLHLSKVDAGIMIIIIIDWRKWKMNRERRPKG